MNYKFKTQRQIESEKAKFKALQKMKEDAKGKKLLKEATYTVTTIDDAILAIQDCMYLIAMKKRNPLVLSDILGSTIAGGIDNAAEIFTADEGKKERIATTLKKKVIFTLRNALGL